MSRLTESLHAQSSKLNITQAELARRLGVTQQAINNLFAGRAASSSYWREISQILQIPESEMRQMMIEAGRDPAKTTRIHSFVRTESGHEIPLPSKSAPPPSEARIEGPISTPTVNKMLPVLGEAVGGDDGRFIFNGQVMDYVACPPSLANVPNAYSVYVDGESMSPRYRPGETVYVHPNKPARRGDDVIVQIHPPSDDGSPPWGYIKEFVGWHGSKLVLHQYNPEKRIEFERNEVVSVHPIILSGKYA